MKRKFSDRANWRRITSKSYQSLYLTGDEFTGYVTLYLIHQLRDPLWKEYNGTRLCLADNGYSWLQHFPKNEHYVVTTMFDAKQHVVQWYIDICKSQGVTDQGVPWFDDLFLDIIVLPSGEVFLLDEDELLEAYEQGAISNDDYRMAKAEAAKVLETIRRNEFNFLQMSVRHRAELFTAVPRNGGSHGS